MFTGAGTVLVTFSGESEDEEDEFWWKGSARRVNVQGVGVPSSNYIKARTHRLTDPDISGTT